MSLVVQNPSKLQKIEFDDGSWIKIPANLTFEMQQQFTPKNKDVDLRDVNQKILEAMIKEWSEVDEAGQPIPVTPENIRKMNLVAVAKVLGKVHELMGLTTTNL